MAYAICREHGAQPAELATENVMKIIREKSVTAATNIYPVTLTYEKLEYSGFATGEDLRNFELIGATHQQADIWEFPSEEAMENALGLFSAVCMQCLSSLTVQRRR
jgi:hypothetical protein